jgi:hypothetical protein
VLIGVQLQTAEDDAEETDAQARQLRKELLCLDLDTVTLASDTPAPAGSKGDAITVGALIMTLGNSAVLVAACQVIRAWVARGRGRRAVIRYRQGTGASLEITGATAAQHQQLIDVFIEAVRRELETADGRDGTGDAAGQ